MFTSHTDSCRIPDPAGRLGWAATALVQGVLYPKLSALICPASPDSRMQPTIYCIQIGRDHKCGWGVLICMIRLPHIIILSVLGTYGVPSVTQSWRFTPAMVRVLAVSSPRWPSIFGGDDPTRIRSGDAGLFRQRIRSKPGQKRLSDTFACCQTADNASSRSDIGSSTSSLLLSATDFLTMNR